MTTFKGRGFNQLTGKQTYTMATINASPWAAQSITVGAASGAFTIGSLNGAVGSIPTLSIDSIGSLLDNSYVKKYEIVETKEDLLVLSCAWYRMRQERIAAQAQGTVFIKSMPDKILDRTLFENIMSDDVQMANDIRDHYSKKIMMLKLKDIKLSKYREDLNTFIHSDGKKFEESICGLVYRLPEFYFHDKKFEEMSFGCNKEIRQSATSGSFRLSHIGTMKVDRKHSKRMEYWFKNENDNLVNIILDPTNPLLKIWDRIILEDIHVHGKYYTKKRDDFEYFSIDKYSLV